LQLEYKNALFLGSCDVEVGEEVEEVERVVEEGNVGELELERVLDARRYREWPYAAEASHKRVKLDQFELVVEEVVRDGGMRRLRLLGRCWR
jgi:hypothetical protein